MKVLNMIFMSVTAFSLAAFYVSSYSDEVLTENLYGFNHDNSLDPCSAFPHSKKVF